MQSYSTNQIIHTGKQKGFIYNSFEFSIIGNYNSSDSLFNHRDIPHFNHLHPNLAYGYGNEGIYYGDVVSFIRYYKLLNFSFPILTLMKNEGEKGVLETFSFFCFHFLKLNEEIDQPDNKCISKITYYIGSKNKFLLKILTPFFKNMFKKSFNDYKNDDHPFLNRRGLLRTKDFIFDRDGGNFTFDSTLDIQTQRCFFKNNSNSKYENLNININEIRNNDITKFGEIGIMGFQIHRKDNILEIFHRVCPHEGGDLDINNEVGLKYTYTDFQKNKCRIRCNVHNRMFKPMTTIDLNDNKKYSSNKYDFILSNEILSISLKNNQNNKEDWTE